MRFCKAISVTLIFLFLFQVIFAYGFEAMYSNYGYGESLAGGNTRYYKYYISSGRISVFTLKNLSSGSDFDLYLYSDEGMNNLVGKGSNSGTKSELEVISQENYGRYVYIKVKNYGNEYASYKLYAHEIDFVKILTDSLLETAAISLLKQLFSSDDDSEEDTRNKARAATVIFSAISGKNLGEIGEELLINEVTTAIQEELGYGFWGDYAVSCATNFIRTIYMYY
jgi:hypothetical protein